MYTEQDVKKALISGYLVAATLPDNIVIHEEILWENYKRHLLNTQNTLPDVASLIRKTAR